MLRPILMILVATVLAAGGQLLLKSGLGQVTRVLDPEAGGLELLWHALRNITVLGGLATYVASAAVYMLGLARLDVSVAFPIVGLSYALVPLAAWLLLGETVPPVRWIGILVICAGVAIVAWSATPA